MSQLLLELKTNILFYWQLNITLNCSNWLNTFKPHFLSRFVPLSTIDQSATWTTFQLLKFNSWMLGMSNQVLYLVVLSLRYTLKILLENSFRSSAWPYGFILILVNRRRTFVQFFIAASRMCRVSLNNNIFLKKAKKAASL